LLPLAQQKSLQFQKQLQGRDRLVRCDRSRVRQVLSNLIGNAIKFTAEGGSVTLLCETAPQLIRFSVADTGPGIDPEHLEHIFDRYWQAARATRQGAGLGLAIAKGIVEAHGGEIWAESRPGAGSTFHFTLPATDFSPQAAGS
jgi:signal transduction histidine kinase